jgi:hypothetical protein
MYVLVNFDVKHVGASAVRSMVIFQISGAFNNWFDSLHSFPIPQSFLHAYPTSDMYTFVYVYKNLLFYSH